MGGGIVYISIDKAAITAHDSVARELALGLGGVAVDVIDGAPDRLAFEVVSSPLICIVDLGEVGGSPGEPDTSVVRGRAHTEGFFVTDGKHTSLERILEEEGLGGQLGASEDMLERIVGIGTAVEVSLITHFHLEGTSIALGAGIGNSVDGTTFIIADDDAGVVLTLGGKEDGVVFTILGAEDDAKSVERDTDGIVKDGIVVGFPEGDGADGGASDNLVGHEGFADSPSGSIGVIKVVDIGAAKFTIGTSGEDGTARLGSDLLESGGCHAATVASPEDVGLVIEDEGTVVVPADVMLAVVGITDIMVEVGLDKGASVVAGATDDGTVGTYRDTVNLEVVKATVFVGKGGETRLVIITTGVDTAVGSKEIGVIGTFRGDIVDGKNLMDAGVDKTAVVIDL